MAEVDNAYYKSRGDHVCDSRNDSSTTDGIWRVRPNAEQGKPPTPRADLRFGTGPDGRVFLLNKHDGMIHMLVPDDYVR